MSTVEELQQRVEALEKALEATKVTKEATKAPGEGGKGNMNQMPDEVSDKYEFPNHPADERYFDKDEKSDKAWIGIANSTKHNLKVRTEVGRDDAGSGRSGGVNLGVKGPEFNLELQVMKESYERIGVQGGSALKNQLVDVTLYKVADGDSEPKKFFSQKIPLTHGLIVIQDGGLKVIPARGQWDPYYRWKPHHNCKIQGLKKHYDPARVQRKDEKKDDEEAKYLEIEKALEIADEMADATAASFIGAIAGLALTPTTRRRIINDYEGTSEAFPNKN